MAAINTSSHPMRARIAASNGTADSLNNSRVVNRFAKKNVNSERERLGALAGPAAAAAYLENDEEEQDSLSDRGNKKNFLPHSYWPSGLRDALPDTDTSSGYGVVGRAIAQR